MSSEAPQIVLIQDSREQLGYADLFEHPSVTGALESGDYSVLGLEHLIGVERKSLPDLLGSLTNGRQRFEAELKRARSLHKFYILVECSPSDLLVPDFGKMSRAHPNSIWGTLCAWSSRYHPFLFGGARRESAKLCEGILIAYAKEFLKGTQAMAKATRQLKTA
ncbi:MAG: ERCC4 domain-containing protein [Desulfomonilaceae bacterium]